MTLVVDVETGRVVVGSSELHHQWVDFYAALALSLLDATSEPQFVGVDEISRIGPWQHKKPGSVGKEIARHIAKPAVEGVLEHRGKTKAWRLTLPAARVRLLPDEEAVRAWLDSRSLRPAASHEWLDDLHRLVMALISLQEGRAEQVLRDLDAPLSDGAAPPARAWAALLRGRAAFQYDDTEVLEQLHEDWFKRADGAGRTVGAKLRAIIAFRDRFHDASDALQTLSHLAAELEMRGDTAALGSILNVMGILLRRAGEPEAALVHHLRAVALLGISGDYPSLEGTLFNLANCRREALEQAGSPPDDSVFSLLELGRAVYSRFTVGQDSAQSEVAGAQWALEAGDPEKARHYLRLAEAIVEKSDNEFDQACFHYARARIEHAFPDGSSDPMKDLRVAERKFEALGDTTALADTRRLLKRVRAGPGSPGRAEGG
ncbi:hypothetical protein [Haliangium ochraceum]|uniref:Uncharacterized protein n=1 Tax=Haliangium ochraceum (strain DSM 14365 / JCM 11303 / SMP-2) TaxID=502025 RepID=D0LPT4_HALO1|nr:hypothetical protein [Haliangium ochraceum]ACY15447.1 hypothetical protein Hoch_2930 [Haliangium ochraceum DSM 14365]